MKRFTFIFLLLVSIFHSKNSLAQHNENFDLESFIESLFNLQEQSLNYEDLYERLLLLYENPIDINSASVKELKGLYILSDPLIDSIQSYIKKNGKFLTLFELQLVPGLEFPTIEKLLPFVTVDPNDLLKDGRPLFQRIINERNNYLILNNKK